MTDHKIEVKDLNFYYGNFRALESINLRIPARQILALLGPSGCGKSTFLRTLNRIGETVKDTRTEGAVLLDQVDIKSLDTTQLRKRVGMVFQRPNPFPKSIFDNVAFGPRVHGLPGPVSEIVERSLRQAELWDEVHDRLSTSALDLSGGQQQRLCIARALALNPEVLLLDEPCSALDPHSTARIEELLVQLAPTCTLIMVTHNMQQASRIAHRTAFFLNGRLIEEGPTQDVFDNPAETATRGYLRGAFG